MISLVATSVALAETATRADCDISEEDLCVYQEKEGDHIAIFARNRKAFEISVELQFWLRNMHLAEPDKNQFVVSANSEQKLATLVITDPYARSGMQYSYWWVPGDFNAKHDGKSLYRLPYKLGSTFYVGQSCNSTGTHQGSHARNAIDFVLPVGTPVHAARGGTVVDLHEVSNSGGLSTMHYDKGNFVQIKHADGTIASYHHLRTMGVKVDLGEHVEAGDFIAYSGDTGYSSGPHLHFVVLQPESPRKTNSISVTWMAARGELTCPRAGLALRAVSIPEQGAND
ncbi:MAG: M23 family metallopeptidase [Pseudomonadota bacterium]